VMARIPKRIGLDRENHRNLPEVAMCFIVKKRKLRSSGANATKATQVNTSLGSKNCVRRFAPKKNARSATPTCEVAWCPPRFRKCSE
jgi:hypothetical protein